MQKNKDKKKKKKKKKIKISIFLFLKKKAVNLFLQYLKENIWKKNSLILPHKFSISFSTLFQISSAISEIIQNILAIA